VLIARMNAERPNENAPALVTRALPDYHLLRPNVVAIPMQLRGAGQRQRDLLSRAHDGRQNRANLSARAREYLGQLGLPDPDSDGDAAELIWLHALAIIYAPEYLHENEDGVKGDFPRVPLPPNATALRNSAALGSRLPICSILIKRCQASRPELLLTVCGLSERSSEPLANEVPSICA
jgi:hypothetical protein